METEDYRLGFENAIMQVREQYELRSKKSLDNAKPKASKVTIKKKPEKTSKATAKSNKSELRVPERTKTKTTKTLINKVNQQAVLTLQLVLLIK